MKRQRRNRSYFTVFVTSILAVFLFVLMDDPVVFSFTAKTGSVTRKRHLAEATLIFSSSSTATNEDPADSRRRESLSQGNNPLFSLNLNLDSLAQVGAADRAQELLLRIHALHKEGYYEVSPDVVSYNSVLKAWKEDDQPEKALELLEAMMEVQTGDDEGPSQMPISSSSIYVDVISFNTVMAAFANQGNYPKALELLRKMQDNENYPNPDTVTYNIALYSLAQSKDRGTASQAENLLREMMKPSSGVSVDTTSFNTVIYAWSQERGGSVVDRGYSVAHRKAMDSISAASAERAHDLLEIMEEMAEAGNTGVRPDVYSYTTVIQSFARSRDGYAKAEDVLKQMTSRGLTPSKITYTALMSALSRAGHPERAYDILQDMMEAYEKGGIVELKPDTVAFSCVIDGWAQVSSIDRPEASTRALEILDIMKSRSNEGMGPNSLTYTSVLTALARSETKENCEMARKLLQEMEVEYDRSGKENKNKEANGGDQKSMIRPTHIQYNCVLTAYSKSQMPNKAILAKRLLDEMHKHPRWDCHPDTISYNSVLHACANAFGNESIRNESFKIGLQIFKAILHGNQCDPKDQNSTSQDLIQKRKDEPEIPLMPTSTTFALFAKCCRRLLPPSQQKPSLTKTLLLCRGVGMVNLQVVQQVQTACKSESDWEEVAGELAGYVGWKADFRKCKQVPNKWCCNARR